MTRVKDHNDESTAATKFFSISRQLGLILKASCATAMMLLFSTPLFAAQNDNTLGFACGGLFLFFAIIFIINILILVWVARDAKARDNSSMGWLILVLVAGPIGLIVYLLARPKGEIIVCQHCNNKKLAAMVKCPTCGN
jgi:hypothetical protein